MLRAVVEAGFQYKNGAAFVRGDRYTDFDFREKHSQGWGTTYQVQRASFDHVLATEAERQGADLRYRHEVTAADFSGDGALLDVHPRRRRTVSHRGPLRAGRQRLRPRAAAPAGPGTAVQFPGARRAFHAHRTRHRRSGRFDRNKIRVGVHPEHHDVWYWLIPFAGGRCSIGVVAETSFPRRNIRATEIERLQALVTRGADLSNCCWPTPNGIRRRARSSAIRPTSGSCGAMATRCSATPANSSIRYFLRASPSR